MIKQQKLSQSKINCFVSCRRKYYYNYIKNIQLKKIYMPFIIGNCIHEGIAKICLNDKNYLKHVRNIFNSRIPNSLSTEDAQKMEIEKITIEGMLTGYSIYYKNNMFKVVTQKGKPLQEVNFESPIIDTVTGKISKYFIASGKVDQIIEMDDGIYLYELKTKKYITPSTIEAIDIDGQVLHYLSYYPKKIKNKKIKGIVYEIIKKPSIRLKKSESDIAYMNRIIDLYVNQNEEYYYRSKHIISKEVLKEYKSNVVSCIKDIIHCTKNNLFYKNYNSCFMYNTHCDFYGLCWNDNPNIESLYENRYKKI